MIESGQKDDLVTKVLQPNEITKKGRKPLVEKDGKYGFDLENIRSHSELSIFFQEITGTLPLSRLATTYLSSDLNLAFYRGNFYLILPQELFQKRKNQSLK